MVSMHEQLAELTLPPVPEFVPPRFGPPRDPRKGYRTLMVGGHEYTHRELAPALEEYGIALMSQHWHTGRMKMAEDLPIGTELILLITTVTGHGLSGHARRLAVSAGIPMIGISTKMSSWPAAFAKYGITPNPSWRVPPPPLTVVRDTGKDKGTDTPVAELTPNQHWGTLFRKVRNDSGLSLAEVADKIGVSNATISDWQRGERTPKYAFYKAMLEIMPGLYQIPPPPDLAGRVFEKLAPTPAEIEAAKPAPIEVPTLSPIALIGVKYAETIDEAETLQREADDAMRRAEELMERAKSKRARAEELQREILTFATSKGAT